MGDEIYVKDYIKSLPAGQLGQFEPVSGLILIDFTTDQVNSFIAHYAGPQAESDLEIARTINHEVFHFAQTVASGYMYKRQHAMFEVFAATKAPPEATVPWDPEREELSPLQQRAFNTLTLVDEMDWTSRVRENAPPGDNSFAAALNPRLFEHLRSVDEAERKENAAHLCINALIEGSAAVHAEMLLAGDSPDPRSQVISGLSALPVAYTSLYELTVAQFGDDALDLLLPATALALRYSNPHEAYFPLVERLHRYGNTPPVAAGRALLETGLPRIRGAGRQLGTASEQHVPTKKFSVYDQMLSELTAGDWGVDAYALLADPEAMRLLSKWPVGLILSDGNWLGDVPPPTLAARLIIMSAFLRVKSRIREERDFEKRATQWLEDFSTRWFWNG
jgi:hypothetical protein